MSFAVALGWSLARGVFVATLGVLIASRICHTLESLRGWTGRWLWALVLLPVFVPGLLIGYGYRNFSLSLVHQPLWNELLYAGLTLLMVVPVGTLILLCSPPAAVSPSALHLAQMSGRWPLRHPLSLSLWIRSRLFTVLPAWGVMFLLTFQETEVATLMQAAGWPEWTFTRLATGTTLIDLLPRLGVPVAVGLVVICSAMAVVGGSHRPAVNRPPTDSAATGRGVSWGYAILALTGLLLLPGSLVLRGAWDGLAVLAAHPALMQQIGIALLLGLTAGLLAWLISGWLIHLLRHRLGLPIVALCLWPGLLGAWTLGVLLSGLFQQPMLRLLYNTPLPMILGEVLFQLPRAMLVRLLLGHWRASTAVYTARLLGSTADGTRRQRSADLLWQLETCGRVIGCLIVCYWASMELSIPSPALLGPPGMTSAPVLLYNQMHYGQIPGLSALVLATLTVPVVSLIVASLGVRSIAAWPASPAVRTERPTQDS